MRLKAKIPEEELRLLSEYTEATSSYAKAARQLERGRPTTTAIEYQRLLEICEDEREACEETRLALESLVVCGVNSNHYPARNVSTIERFSDAHCSPDSPD